MMRQIQWSVQLPVLCLTLASCGDSGPGDAGEPLEVVTTSGVPMIHLKGGGFMMGSETGGPDETPVHRVQVSPFLIDRTEVTHAMFALAELPNPSKWKDDARKPVESIRWRAAKIYCNERSLMEGLEPCYDEKKPGLPCDFGATGYRLPTEAEWEYAARCGTGGDYDFGESKRLKQYAFYEDNSNGRTHPVGSKKPNRWGLYGMYGNVSEWCHDAYDPDYYRSSPLQDPTGPETDASDVRRAVRGGSWKASANMCRSAFRQGKQTGDSDACFTADYCGFRCVRRISADELSKLTVN